MAIKELVESEIFLKDGNPINTLKLVAFNSFFKQASKGLVHIQTMPQLQLILHGVNTVLLVYVRGQASVARCMGPFVMEFMLIGREIWLLSLQLGPLKPPLVE